MKKKTIFIVLAVIIISALIYTHNAYSTARYKKDRYLIDVSDLEIIYDDDTHGGFFGDGERYIIFDSSGAEDFEEQIISWRKMPLTDNLQLLMYGGERDGVTYGFHFTENYDIPEITDGRFYFIDRLNETTSDSDVFARPSLNFTVFMYDEDSLMLYMLEVDT